MTISPEFPYGSRYAEVLGSRMHYIEQGEGPVFLFLHGNPTWSYLWRNVIPGVSKHARCIAVDLIGFGKSGRPRIGYRFLDHYRYLAAFIEKLGLRDIVIVGHDWGGVLGFHYALEHRENVRGIAFMESFPFTFSWDDFPPEFRRGFRLLRTPLLGRFLIQVLNVFIEKIMPASVKGGMPKEVHDNYRKPFPTVRSRYPVYVWPNELPIEGKETETFAIVREVEKNLPEIEFPVLLVTAQPGAIIKPGKVELLKRNIRDLTVTDIGPGLHYVQEDNPEGVARAITAWAEEKGLFKASEIKAA